MALDAVEVRALEAGFVRLVLVENIKDGALRRIERHEFERHAVVNAAYIDVVIEIKRARFIGRDLRVLKAGLGIHQSLRVDGDVEQPQHRSQIALAGFVLQL